MNFRRLITYILTTFSFIALMFSNIELATAKMLTSSCERIISKSLLSKPDTAKLLVLKQTQNYGITNFPSGYKMSFGQPIEIKDQTVIQGSQLRSELPQPGFPKHLRGLRKLVKSGQQPTYVIDFEKPLLKEALDYAKKLNNADINNWEKIRELITYTKKALSKPRQENEYDTDPNTRETALLQQQFRQKEFAISLDDYINRGCGVCREHAILLQLLVSELGIKAKYAYVKIGYANTTEDHAIVIIELNGKKWVIDAYYGIFNGRLLDDLLHREYINPNNTLAPAGRAINETVAAQIIEFLPYPKIWNLLD